MSRSTTAASSWPPRSRSGAVVEVEGLEMSYGTQRVLTGVELSVQAGEVVCILGPNGAGKSTTVEVIEGFRVPSAGSVRVFGVDPLTAGEAWRARIGVVLQSWRDHGRWTPRQLLSYLGAFYEPYSTAGRPRPHDPDELLEAIGLGEHAGRQIQTLSGGQRRRLDVAIGIVGRPELLFLDEPTAGFDPQARREFHETVHRLTDLEETTVLLTTHDLDEAEKLADRILVLADGRIVADGSPAQLTRQLGNASEVRWNDGGARFVHSTDDATAFVRRLLLDKPFVTELEVRRATLEDTYLHLVRAHEQGDAAHHAGWLPEVAR